MSGIAVAGTVIVDRINEIAEYPNSGELAKITKVSRAAGGCVPNVAVGLKTLAPSLTVKAVGKIGADDDGRFVIERLKKCGADASEIVVSGSPTDFTEVMSVKGGQRTFFNYSGAGAAFCARDVDFERLNVKMLHLGYFLLLDAVDNGDGIEILREAKARGIKTSIDLVSENSNRYENIIPLLKYTDNLIINEIEAGRLAGIEPSLNNLKAIAEKLYSFGVGERVIVHCPEVGVCMSSRGFSFAPSLQLPDGFIRGTTGAGDAFCAGALLGIYNKKSDLEILETASVVAAGALSRADATSGLTECSKLLKTFENYKRKKICL